MKVVTKRQPTEDEMRDEIGMDPIPDGDREKMFVELITRENLRIEAELNLQAQKEAAKQQGTAETNNKQKFAKNQWGQLNRPPVLLRNFHPIVCFKKFF